MCGIVGYIGTQQAYPILIKGLYRLEYRGYDSAGVAMINAANRLLLYKAMGKVQQLESTAQGQDCSGTMGIAHTRWATHGEPSVKNAHPHSSESGRLAMVHNGIIENYEPLRQMLLSKGYHFRSETDSEVLVQLIEYVLIQEQCDLATAVQHALQQVNGAYAIAVLDQQHPDVLVAARKGSPLVIGLGEGEYFLASDAMPLVEYTHRFVFVGEEQVITLRRDAEPVLTSLNGEQLPIKVSEVNLSVDQLEKGGFDHYMLKEVFEQPQTLRATLQHHLQNGSIVCPGFDENKERFLATDRIIICACGTSWHAGLIAKYALEELAHIPCEVEYASEFRYRNPIIRPTDMVIAISQSGETADTLAAIQLAKSRGAFIFSICNVAGSSIPRESDACCYTHVGPEIGVASTKAFTAQVLTLTILSLALAAEKHTITPEQLSSHIAELQQLPQKMETILLQNDAIRAYARTFQYSNAIYLGRGYNFPIALEGALKLKEISYLHAEGYPAAEMKHGPIALISEEMPVVVVAPHSAIYEKMVSNVRVIKARQGRVVAVVTEGDTQLSELADFVMTVPTSEECLSPVLAVVPLQMLAYHIAVARGCNVDQPRNLAKSVTVE